MKVQVKEKNALYPMPVTIIGANVDGKPNYLTVAWVGILNMDTISLGLNKLHYSNKGIIENKTFSVNIPSEDMVVETDYLGLISGKNKDKSKIFETVYGSLKTAPMIVKAPISMECELIDKLDYRTHEIFIGHVANVYAEDHVLINGTIDLSKVRPMLFDMHLKKYWKLGEPFADCWKIGNTMK